MWGTYNGKQPRAEIIPRELVDLEAVAREEPMLRAVWIAGIHVGAHTCDGELGRMPTSIWRMSRESTSTA